MKARHVRVLRRHIDAARRRSIRAPGKNGKVRTVCPVLKTVMRVAGV